MLGFFKTGVNFFSPEFQAIYRPMLEAGMARLAELHPERDDGYRLQCVADGANRAAWEELWRRERQAKQDADNQLILGAMVGEDA